MRKLIVLLVVMSTCIISAQKSEDSKDVPFQIIEQVPVFPGCRGNHKKLKKCFNKKMIKHLSKKFNSEIANKINLPPGETRMLLIFKIDKNGVATDFNVKAAHEELKKEGIRVLKLLPKFRPGTMRGKPVSVKYSIPMKIMVEESKKKKN